MPSPDEDVKKLQRLATVAAPNTTLRKILDEACASAKKVFKYENAPTSGHAVCHYKKDSDEPEKYKVVYQAGDMGNLVHELTHVSVNEAYKLDFVNYPSKGKNVPTPDYDGERRRKNEDLRQGAWMVDQSNTTFVKELKDLGEKAKKASFDQDKLKKITDKLVYGSMNPHKEHDTVLNQIMVWLFEWGYAPTPNDKKLSPQQTFYNELEKVVLASYDRRKKGNK